MKRYRTQILIENEQDFETSLKYLAKGTLSQDGKDFAKRYAGSEEQLKDFEAIVDDVDKRLSNEAEGLVSMFDELDNYGKASTDHIAKLAVADNLDDWFDEYIEAVKAVKKNPDDYVKSAEKIRDFLKTGLQKLDSDEIDNIKKGKDNFLQALGLGSGPILKGISALGASGKEGNPRILLANMPWFGKKEDSSESAEGDIPNDSIPVDTSAPIEDQVDQLDDQLDDSLLDLSNMEKSMAKVIKDNPPPDDDYEAMNKSWAKLEKYHQFLMNKLYRKISDYAAKKNRKDIVALASKNIQTLKTWMKTFEESTDEVWNEIQSEKNADSDGLPKSYKSIIDIYDQATKDLASVIKTVKSDPLKELNAEKLTEGLRKHKNMLFERRCVRISKHVISLGD